MFAEQEQYKQWLLTQPPDEILHHCYEFVVREDIVLALEEHDLSSKQCKALLQSKTPLADVFRKWESWETGYMDHVLECIESRANEVLRADFVASRRDGR